MRVSEEHSRQLTFRAMPYRDDQDTPQCSASDCQDSATEQNHQADLRVASKLLSRA
jgi:hypothetical protein